jgi:hypothetical protein
LTFLCYPHAAFIVATREQVLEAMERAFAFCPTPREYCHGGEGEAEAAQSEMLFRSRTRDALIRQDLGSDPASDPVTFLTTEGFCYFMPRLAKMALTADEEQSYLYQFIMQLTPERIAAFSLDQRLVVLRLLEYARQESSDDPIATIIDRRMRRLQAEVET